jgi:UPF0042 nucleotide-binding protein
MNNTNKGKIILVSGMSGAGKSIALKTLEDIGYEAVDNVPLSILPLLVSHNPNQKYLAVGIDIRNRDFSVDNFFKGLKQLHAEKDFDVTFLFIDCTDEILQRRFSETRRKHPISKEHLITDGIKHEREMLGTLCNEADLIIDSSDLTSSDLKKYIKANFSTQKNLQLSIVISSFSFRQGVPHEADLVFDVRFLNNPFYVENLKEFNGTNSEIGKYIEQDPNLTGFYNNLISLLLPLLPLYNREGKNYLSIAIGCTGGKHRSVYVAEKLKKTFKSHGYKVDLRHRALYNNYK